MHPYDLRRELEELNLPQIRWFAARNALRLLPLIAKRGEHFNGWKINKDNHLFSTLRAINFSFLIIFKNKNNYSEDIINVIRSDSWKSHKNAYITTELTYVTEAAYSTVPNNIASSAASAVATAIGNFTEDILLLKETKNIPEWMDLWHKNPPDWQAKAEQNLLEGLENIGFRYWKKQYLNWVQGKFDLEEMERAFYIPQEIYDAGVPAMLAYLEGKEIPPEPESIIEPPSNIIPFPV